jgi:uncharacterized membrane protein
MKQIAVRVWKEPAVFIGLLTTVALVVITVATGGDWDAAVIVAVIAPLVEALGIRQFVKPTYGEPHE